MEYFFAEIKFFRFWPKTMDYSLAFWPKLRPFFVVFLLLTGRRYEAEICTHSPTVIIKHTSLISNAHIKEQLANCCHVDQCLIKTL